MGSSPTPGVRGSAVRRRTVAATAARRWHSGPIDAPPTPTLEQYAAQHGLRHRLASLALPKATQLMRHGFLQEVPSLTSGTLPGGLENSWLAQVDYAYEGRSEIERSRFTLVLAEAPASAGFAVRVLCHDRGLSKRDRENPDADREVVELDDRLVQLESSRFLERYALSTDHDQDQLTVWQLFDPSMIQWLGEEAPSGFSFEVQDGALNCFVPGFTAEEAELDALCAAAVRIFARLSQIESQVATQAAPGSREDAVDRELAEHPFDSPPQSTKEAAKEFRHGLRLGDHAWALGAEAFFREHAAAAGFEPIGLGEYRAANVDTFLPGIPRHAARGRLPDGETPAFLVFTDSEDYEDMGWSALVVGLRSPMQGFAVAGAAPRGDSSKRGSIQVGTDGRSLIVTALDGGPRDRKAAEFDAFFAAACGVAAQLGDGESA